MTCPTSDMHFFLRIEPEPPRVTHQQKKFGGVMKDGKTPIYYEPEHLKRAREMLTALLSKLAPKKPFGKAVMMEVVWAFKGKKVEWFTKRPDGDNLQKLLQDVMKDCGFFTDDSIIMPFVTKIALPKEFAHGIVIRLTELGEVPDYIDLTDFIPSERNTTNA